MMQNVSDIGQSVRDLSYDLKAEAVVADLVENGLESDDFIAVPIGMFKRRYSHDIASTGIIELKNGSRLLAINLNRDAIYDGLPEGFFHQNREHTVETKNISRKSKKLKEEEKAARNFFLPFENEIFSQRVSLELEERRILNRFSEHLADDFSTEFWKIDPSIDHDLLSAMVKFMHISYKIAGNTKLTEKCLGAILKEDVLIKTVRNRNPVTVKRKTGKKRQISLLGTSTLGVDLICGNEFPDAGYTMRFEIGPVRNSSIEDYLKKGRIRKFLKCFFGFFVPAETDVSVSVIVAKENCGFTLSTHGEGAILGYKTAI
jgi:hypothetical protein